MKENIDFVVCQICGKQMKQITYKHLKFHNITTKQYKEQYPNSMIRCENSKNLHIEHQNSTNNKKYGYDRPLQNKDIKNKANKTLLTNYGVNNAFNIDGVSEKSKLTQLLKYGAETPFDKNSLLRKKINEFAQTDIAKDKRLRSFRNTCIEKYNVEHTWKIKSIRIKCVNTMFKKYGYKSVFSDKNIIEKAMKKCMSKEPNKPEKIILDIIGDRGQYSGNGTFWLKFKNGNNKNPDFKIHGKNKVIEHYGEYWHRNDLAEDIVKLYNKIGYECLVIWEYELKDLSCIKYKINSFINN